jgi:ATP-dependent RNA helicase DDX23/PRP28
MDKLSEIVKKRKSGIESQKILFIPKSQRIVPENNESKDESSSSNTSVKPMNVEISDDYAENPWIKDRFMKEKVMKKRVKPRDFKFEWDAEDDTSSNYQPLYYAKSNTKKPQGLEKNSIFPSKYSMDEERNWREKNLDEMSSRDWRIMREDYNSI